MTFIYSRRLSRAGGNPKAKAFFFALGFPIKFGTTTVRSWHLSI